MEMSKLIVYEAERKKYLEQLIYILLKRYESLFYCLIDNRRFDE